MQRTNSKEGADKLIKLSPQQEILNKPSPVSTAFRAIIITADPKKFEEFRAQLGDGYGMDVEQWAPEAGEDLNDEQVFATVLTTRYD